MLAINKVRKTHRPLPNVRTAHAGPRRRIAFSYHWPTRAFALAVERHTLYEHVDHRDTFERAIAAYT